MRAGDEMAQDAWKEALTFPFLPFYCSALRPSVSARVEHRRASAVASAAESVRMVAERIPTCIP